MSFVFLGQDIESCSFVLSEECSIVRVGAPVSGGSPQSVAVCVRERLWGNQCSVFSNTWSLLGGSQLLLVWQSWSCASKWQLSSEGRHSAFSLTYVISFKWWFCLAVLLWS